MGRPAIARAALSIEFEPSQPFADGLIRWLTQFCELTLEDVEAASRAQMAVNELVENVVKYGMNPSVGVEVELERLANSSVLTLRTKNRTTPERLAATINLLRALEEAPDPVAYYDQLVVASAPKADVSGLGLARIRAEGDLDVHYEVHGDQLCLSVSAILPSEGLQ
jgi:hypothetical protein